ncbi:hypothetical protein OC845_001034 [Tilletia horrida]|nr:hypothetical protein OC845_001034 [Tilletia horrida]
MTASLGPYQIFPIGLGLMSLTRTAEASQMTPDPEAFAVIKAALDKSRDNERVVLNSCTVYGPQSDPYANLTLIRRFFQRYPEMKDAAVIIVKGAVMVDEYRAKGKAGFRFSTKLEDLRRDLVEVRRELGCDEDGIKLHSYGPGRRDLTTSIEETVQNLVTLQKEGLFEHIHLSELGSDTIVRAAETAKQLGSRVESIELEYSPLRSDIERNGVLDACKSHGITVLAYSPVGKGLLTGQLQDIGDIPSTDPRRKLDAFSEQNLDKNIQLARTFGKVAAEHDPPCTPAQLALAWLTLQGDEHISVVPIPGTTKAHRVEENMAAGDAVLTVAEKRLLQEQLASMSFHGGRYSADVRARGNLDG